MVEKQGSCFFTVSMNKDLCAFDSGGAMFKELDETPMKKVACTQPGWGCDS